MRRSVAGWTLCQSKVETATTIITATSAGIGIRTTRPPRPTTRTRRKTPALNVESRVRAPLTRTLIIVWPIIAQPAIPPKKPVTTFATPWPVDSRSLFERVSVMLSTSRAVISDSSSPTAASPIEYGAMIFSVSSENGTDGRPGSGRESGQLPLVADGRHVDVAGGDEEREHGDRDERRRHGLRHARHADDQREPGQHEQGARDAAVAKVRDLREEDQDRERVHEPDRDRARHEPHQPRDPEQAERHLEQPGEDRRGEQVLEAVVAHQRHDHERHRAGRGRDHRGAPAGDRDRDGHRERRVQPHARIDSGDQRERDRLGNQRERDDEPREKLDAEKAGREGRLRKRPPERRDTANQRSGSKATRTGQGSRDPGDGRHLRSRSRR